MHCTLFWKVVERTSDSSDHSESPTLTTACSCGSGANAHVVYQCSTETNPVYRQVLARVRVKAQFRNSSCPAFRNSTARRLFAIHGAVRSAHSLNVDPNILCGVDEIDPPGFVTPEAPATPHPQRVLDLGREPFPICR